MELREIGGGGVSGFTWHRIGTTGVVVNVVMTLRVLAPQSQSPSYSLLWDPEISTNRMVEKPEHIYPADHHPTRCKPCPTELSYEKTNMEKTQPVPS
jgi:hypothetical protein